MSKLLKPTVIAVLIVVILFCVYAIVMRTLRNTSPSLISTSPPEWTRASSLLLDIDYEFKTDTFNVIEGDSYDYQLNLIALDWGIYIHRIKGFAKAFIIGKPSAELYQLLGDSDIFKWQKAWKITTSEPVYSIYKKDDAEHLRQDYSFDVSKNTRVPDYFPPGLSADIASGSITKVAAGNFYYVSSDDIYMVHFISPYPLGERDTIIVETINRIKFNISSKEAENVEKGNSTNATPPANDPDKANAAPTENETETEKKPQEPPRDQGNGSSGDGSIKPLPPIDN